MLELYETSARPYRGNVYVCQGTGIKEDRSKKYKR